MLDESGFFPAGVEERVRPSAAVVNAFSRRRCPPAPDGQPWMRSGCGPPPASSMPLAGGGVHPLRTRRGIRSSPDNTATGVLFGGYAISLWLTFSNS